MKLFALIAVFLFISCGGNNSTSPANTQAKNDSLAQAQALEWHTPLALHGYIGNNAVEVEFVFCKGDTALKGSYRYATSKLNLSLVSIKYEWFNGDMYALAELNNKKDTTGKWIYLRYELPGYYEARFISANEKIFTEIVLLPDTSSMYLDSCSKMVFENAKACATFFKTNKFLHNEIRNKQGLIFKTLAPNQEIDPTANLLPKGLKIYRHNGGDGFGVEEAGLVDTGNTIRYTNGEIISFAKANLEQEETGYGTYTSRFVNVMNPQFIAINQIGNEDLFVSIDELNKMGWYLMGDCFQVKQNSGKVLGYYPTYNTMENATYERNKINIYKTRDATTKPILVIDHEQGHFLVNDVRYFNGEHWVNIIYDYYAEIPCTNEKLKDKPSVKGWIKLYDKMGDKKILSLYHYERGC
jgi:hypothetical protein